MINFDIQRFASKSSFNSLVDSLAKIGEEISVEPDGSKITTVGKIYDLANLVSDLWDSIKNISKDIKNRKFSDGFLESLSALANAVDGLFLIKLGNSVPLFGLAAVMPKLTLAIREAEEDKKSSTDGSISQNKINDLVTNFIDFIGETVKTLLFLVPGGVISTLAELTIFPILIDTLTATFKTQYLTSVDSSLDLNDTFSEQFLGENNLISVIVGFFNGKIKSADYSSDGLIKIVDEDGNTIFYNHTPDIQIDLPNQNNRFSNYVYGVNIAGGSKNDTIYSNPNTETTQQGNTIKGGSGDDFIVINEENNSTVYGETGDDKIAVLGNSNKIYGGYGNDMILLEQDSKNNLVNGGFGDDIIILEDAQNSTIEYAIGDGNDYIFGYSESDKIVIDSNYSTAKSGDDIVLGVGTGSITLIGSNGKTININDKKIVTYDNKNSNNDRVVTIPSFWDNNVKTIHGTSGADNIKNSLDNMMIDTYAGNDTINNIGSLIKASIGSQVTINAGTGDDSIYNGGSQVIINASEGNDYIENNGANVTINASDGNDSIYNYEYGLQATINTEDGDDYILNSGANVTINAGDGNDDIRNYGSQVTINAEDGVDHIWNLSSQVTIDAGDGNDYISNNGSLIAVNAGDGDDYVSNDGSLVTINAEDGNDNIRNHGSLVTINAGDGNDYVYNDISPYDDSQVIINTGNGDDSITNHGSLVTINAGDGNDDIHNLVSQVTINAGDGNDDIYNSGSQVTINSGSGDDFISLGSYYNSFYIHSYDSVIEYANGDGKDTIYGYNSTDTIHITNSSYSTVNSGNDVIIKVGTGSITIKNSKDTKISIKGTVSSNSTVNGGGDSSSSTIGSGNNDTLTTTVNGGDDGTSTSTSISTTLTVNNFDNSPVTVASSIKTIDASKRTSVIKITGNALANTIKGGSSSDTIYGIGGNDLILGNDGNDKLYGDVGADTINGGTGNDTLSGGAGNDVFIYALNSGNDVITDYTAGQNKISITGAKISKTSVSGSDVILTVGSGNIKIKNGKGKKLSLYNNSSSLTTTVIGGSKTITVNNSTKSPVTVSADVTTIDATKRSTAVKITGNTKANTIKGGSGKDTIYGGNGNDSILGNSGNDKLYGDVGNDTLNGGKGNDTLTGGTGKDVFFFASSEGNDIITDYSSTQGDLIRLGTSSMSTSMSGNNVILKVSTGKITVNNAKSQQVSVIGSTGKSTVIGGATTLNVTNSTKSPVTAVSIIKVIDASKPTTAVKLTGNSLANTIKGGSAVDTVYGGAGNDSILGNNGNDKLFGDNGNDTLRGGVGNDSVSGDADADKLYGDNGADTLNGGKGNDTLTGGNGNDVFVYANGDGNDVIADYTAKQDKIKLTSGTINSSSLKGSDVVLKIGSGSITIKNGKNKSITVIDSKNKSTSKVYGNSSKNYIEKLWFENDDSVADDEITAITQQNITSDNTFNNATGQLIHYNTNNILLNNQQITSSLAYNRKK